MAVTSLLTSLEDFESPGATFLSIGSGGGATDNTDVFIEGAQSGGRRIDNATAKGFMATLSSTDLSAAGEHCKQWVFCFHWPQVTALSIRIRSGSNVYDNHVVPLTQVPVVGGWIPLWVDVSRAPDSQGSSGSANEAAITDIGSYITIGNVGGAGDNYIMDEIHHGTSGLRWTGTGPGDMADFRTFEDTNVEGNMLTLNGVDFCYSRLEIGNSTTETDFTDSGFTLAFPDNTLVASTFMGVTIVCNNASSVIDISQATIQSADPAGATSRPDLLISGTLGTCDFDTVNFLGLRVAEFTSVCSATNCIFSNCGQIALNEADLAGSSILSSIAAADTGALLDDRTTTTATSITELNNTTFSKGTAAHHAIDFGTNVDDDITLTGIEFTGFSGTADANDATVRFLATSGSINLNLINCTVDGGSPTWPAGNFGVDDAAGITVNVVVSPVTTKVTIEEGDGTPIQNAIVLLETGDNGGGSGLPYQAAYFSLTQTAGTATFTALAAHGLATNDYVVIRGAGVQGYNKAAQITVTGASTFTYSVGSGISSPAGGTPVFSYAALSGLTDINGEIESSKTWPAVQSLVGWVRRSTTAPFFKQSAIAVTDASGGTDILVVLQRDE